MTIIYATNETRGIKSPIYKRVVRNHASAAIQIENAIRAFRGFKIVVEVA